MGDKGVTNIVLAGLGGQGVIKASDISAKAIFAAGLDIKKSEIHGMSQRGGSVTSDIRYGREVLSPMVPPGEADFLVVLDMTQVEPNQHLLSSDGVLITPEMLLKEGQTVDQLDSDPSTPVNRRNINVALIGILSAYLDIPESRWLDAIHACLPEKVHAANEEVFALGREVGKKAAA